MFGMYDTTVLIKHFTLWILHVIILGSGTYAYIHDTFNIATKIMVMFKRYMIIMITIMITKKHEPDDSASDCGSDHDDVHPLPFSLRLPLL